MEAQCVHAGVARQQQNEVGTASVKIGGAVSNGNSGLVLNP
jgi:hypothetical protein